MYDTTQITIASLPMARRRVTVPAGELYQGRGLVQSQ